MLKKILIVDDDDYLCDIYKEAFTESGYQVDVAGDGEEGYAKIVSGNYDLVLLDVMMPKLDGIGVLRKLQINRPKFPIVLLTNLDHAPLLQEGLALGAKTYIIKANYTPDTFLKTVTAILNNP